MNKIKQEAKKIIDKLPNNSTWDDLMYKIYVKNKLAVALKAAAERRIVSHKAVKKRFCSK